MSRPVPARIEQGKANKPANGIMIRFLPNLLTGNSAFRRFLAASLLSGTGLQASRIALVIALFGEHGTPALVAGYIFFETVPGALLGPRAGALSDKITRRKVMMAAEAGRALLLLLICLIPTVPVIFGAAAAGSILSALYQSARDASIPDLVETEDLAKANGIDQGGTNAIMVIGPILGALAYSTAGLAAALGAAILLFLASAWLLARLTVTATVVQQCASMGAKAATPSLRARLRLPVDLRILLVIFFSGTLASALWLPFAPALVETELSAGAEAIGWLAGLCGAGGVIGSLVMPAIMERVPLRRLILLGAMAEAGCVCWFALSPTLTTAAIAMFSWGLVTAAITTPLYTLLHANVARRHRGEVFGLVRRLDFSGITLATLIGMVIGGAVAPRTALTAVGLAYLFGALLCAAALSRTPLSRAPMSRASTVEEESA